MTHDAKFDWWSVGAIAFGLLVVLAGLSAYPQSYVTTPAGLEVRAGVMHRIIPYQNITFIEPAAADTVKVQYGPNSLFLEPEDPDAFFRDLVGRVPRLRCERTPDPEPRPSGSGRCEMSRNARRPREAPDQSARAEVLGGTSLAADFPENIPG